MLKQGLYEQVVNTEIKDELRQLPENSKRYLTMVDAKLDEELAEYHADKNLEELSDLLEVLYAAAIARGSNPFEERLQ